MFQIETLRVDIDPKKWAQTMIKAQGPFKVTGRGAYASVYGHDNSALVYKLGRVYENSPYLAYLKALAGQTRHNPYVPKIYGVRIIERIDGGDPVFVVAMERLERLPVQPKKDTLKKAWTEHLLLVQELVPEPSRCWTPIRRYCVDPRTRRAALRKKALRQTMDLLKRIKTREYHAAWDLHEGNFMLRQQQLVVTDPFSLC